MLWWPCQEKNTVAADAFVDVGRIHRSLLSATAPTRRRLAGLALESMLLGFVAGLSVSRAGRNTGWGTMVFAAGRGYERQTAEEKPAERARKKTNHWMKGFRLPCSRAMRSFRCRSQSEGGSARCQSSSIAFWAASKKWMVG